MFRFCMYLLIKFVVLTFEQAVENKAKAVKTKAICKIFFICFTPIVFLLIKSYISSYNQLFEKLIFLNAIQKDILLYMINIYL